MAQKKTIRTLIIGGSMGLLIICMAILGGRQLGPALVMNSPTDKADALVVLGGGKGIRVEYASTLFEKKIAPLVIMCGDRNYFGEDYANHMARYAQKLGIPQECIIKAGVSHSTYEDAQQLLNVVQERQLKRIVIITSKYHTKRAWRVFKKAFKGQGVELYIMGAPDGIDYTNWWKHHNMQEEILIEWAKNIVYWIKY